MTSFTLRQPFSNWKNAVISELSCFYKETYLYDQVAFFQTVKVMFDMKFYQFSGDTVFVQIAGRMDFDVFREMSAFTRDSPLCADKIKILLERAGRERKLTKKLPIFYGFTLRHFGRSSTVARGSLPNGVPSHLEYDDYFSDLFYYHVRKKPRVFARYKKRGVLTGNNGPCHCYLYAWTFDNLDDDCDVSKEICLGKIELTRYWGARFCHCCQEWIYKFYPNTGDTGHEMDSPVPPEVYFSHMSSKVCLCQKYKAVAEWCDTNDIPASTNREEASRMYHEYTGDTTKSCHPKQGPSSLRDLAAKVVRVNLKNPSYLEELKTHVPRSLVHDMLLNHKYCWEEEFERTGGITYARFLVKKQTAEMFDYELPSRKNNDIKDIDDFGAFVKELYAPSSNYCINSPCE